MKKKICVIFTGGTIGSTASGGSVNLSDGTKRLLLNLYEESEGNSISFDALAPINILSENVQPRDLNALVSCIEAVNSDDYDGIIITHGTDTLCFTANYLSLVFASYPLPIVFVSSLYPLTDERSNGLDNFKGAVSFIENERLSGVYVSFKNGGENCKIHLASRLVFCDELNGHYHSAFDEHFAELLSDGKFIYPATPHNPAKTEVASRQLNCMPAGLNQNVILITARSLLDFSIFDFSRVKPQAVIVELYHSGTVGTKGAYNFINFAAYCKEHGVPLVIAPLDSKASVYGSMATLPENVIKAYDLTLEMTLVKVMAALSKNLPVNTYFNKNFFFEKLERQEL
jgi:L-asparaginase